MAIKISKPGLKGFSFGVRGSLFAAFAVIAGMAIMISSGAGVMLGRLGGTMGDLSGRDIPRLAASLQLSAQSTSLANQGPALLASRSEEALNDRTKKMKETQTIALQKLGERAEDCVAVEDNVGGVAAARAAGIPVVAFPNANTAGHDFGDVPRHERRTPAVPRAVDETVVKHAQQPAAVVVRIRELGRLAQGALADVLDQVLGVVRVARETAGDAEDLLDLRRQP